MDIASGVTRIQWHKPIGLIFTVFWGLAATLMTVASLGATKPSLALFFFVGMAAACVFNLHLSVDIVYGAGEDARKPQN